jgi:15,16-dihydrobiliverdin:ferredoxin oxidoreductase
MKAQHILLAIPAAIGVDAFSATSSNAFLPSSGLGLRATSAASLNMSADGNLDIHTVQAIEMKLAKANLPLTLKTPSSSVSVEEMEASNNMPWSDTIGKSDHPDPLLYMPFWEWQLEHMKESLTNLKADDTALADFGYKDNKDKKARIVNQCYTSDEYRKIRMTYYDAGDNTQVFNSVWYPDPKYNLPVLGIDLLAFNRKKYLAIVDFQPLYDNEEDHAMTYESRLKPIKDNYDSLKGRMSSKFYDETQFFSQQMLFARFEDESVVSDDLFPAFKRYVKLHNKLVDSCEPDHEGKNAVLDRQTEYDTYSAERDPATGLFAAMFGKEWADDFVFDFLFANSERKEGGVQIPPMFGGGGPPGGKPPQGAPQKQAQKSKEAVPAN